MIYRRIGADDIEQTTDFAIEGLDPERYPLVFSREKTRTVVEHFTKTERDFQLAAFDGDRMVGAVAAAVAEMLWFERCEAHIVFLYATKPGVGATLLRRLLKWAADDPMIRRVVWAQNEGADPRTSTLARRCAKGGAFSAKESTMQVFIKD